MDEVRSVLAGLFTYVFYPAIVVAIFTYLGWMIFYLVFPAMNRQSRIRRSVAAMLPQVVLVFLFTTDPKSIAFIDDIVARTDPLTRIAAGLIAGIAMLESAHWFMPVQSDVLASTYALFVSCVVAFLLWAFIGGTLSSLNLVLLGFVITGGLHVVYRGPPPVLLPNHSGNGPAMQPESDGPTQA